MTPHDVLNGTPTVLAAMHEFHRLAAKCRGAPRLSADEKTLLAIIEEMFEPLRIAAHGLRRRPIALTVNRTALVLTAEGPHRARVVRIALRRAWVKTEDALPRGAEVGVAIASATDRRFFVFRGCVRRTNPTTQLALVAILAADGEPPGARRGLVPAG